MAIDTEQDKRAFDLINKLIESRSGGPAAVEKLFGIKLAPAEGSNSYFEMAGANVGSEWYPLTHVEIRNAIDGSGRGLIDLFFDPSRSGCLQKDFVVSRLGTHFKVSVQPPPFDVRKMRTSYGWPQPWGTLSASFSADTPGCVSEIVIDYL